MSEIKRYAFYGDSVNSMMVPDQKGRFVDYADYAAEIERLKAEIETWKKHHAKVVQERHELLLAHNAAWDALEKWLSDWRLHKDATAPAPFSFTQPTANT